VLGLCGNFSILVFTPTDWQESEQRQMKFTHLVKLALLAVLSLQLGCLKSPGNPDPSNFSADQPEQLNAREQLNVRERLNVPRQLNTRERLNVPERLNVTGGLSVFEPGGSASAPNYQTGMPVQAADGRILLAKPGTWDVLVPVQPRDMYATTPSGQRIIVRPDGTWVYPEGGRIAGPTIIDRGSGRVGKRGDPPPPPKPGKIYFYQLDGDGGVRKATVFMDGRPVAALRAKRYFAISVSPGPHIFTISKQDQSPLRVDVKSGKDHFLKNVGGMINREKFQRAGDSEGKADISQLNVVKGEDVSWYDIMVEPRM
jgi:hypothetical protein